MRERITSIKQSFHSEGIISLNQYLLKEKKRDAIEIYIIYIPEKRFRDVGERLSWGRLEEVEQNTKMRRLSEFNQ